MVNFCASVPTAEQGDKILSGNIIKAFTQWQSIKKGQSTWREIKPGNCWKSLQKRRDFEIKSYKKEEENTHKAISPSGVRICSKANVQVLFWMKFIFNLKCILIAAGRSHREKKVFLQWHRIHFFTSLSSLKKIVYQIISLIWNCSYFVLSVRF